MSIEQKINYLLNRTPYIKKGIKRIYQRVNYAISPKIKSEGNIRRVVPNDNKYEYFFGYYDKSPWDITDRYMLCLRAKNTWSDVSPKEKADILIIDTQKDDNDSTKVKKIGETRSWNVQQACMLQWLGPDFSSKILYNDYRDGKYVSVILELDSGKERIIPAAVYSVSSDGKFALTLDFSRLYNLRPGYGYYNVPEKTKGIGLPDATAIWKVDLETGDVKPLFSYKDFATFKPRVEMNIGNAVHKVNHIMLSPNGKRFMVLYRWFVGHRKYTRLITCNIDGSDMYVLSDDDMVSHCCWKNNSYILAFENKKMGGTGYYLMKDKTDKYMRCWRELSNDGHPSYSPNGKYIITDTYPNRSRIQFLRLMRGEKGSPKVIAKVFSPFKYDNDTRCDLHPRWNHNGTAICFDSVFEGRRGLYTVDIAEDEDEHGFDMEQIRFIMPLHGFYNQLIQRSGYDIKNPYKGNSLLFRPFREIHFRLRFPHQSIWFNKENITSKKYIIVFEPLITGEYLSWLHNVNPNGRIILFYINKINQKNSPDNFRYKWLEMWTCDRSDSEKYNINLYDRPAYFKAFKVKKQKSQFDIFYVGKDKGRIGELLKIEKSFNSKGLSTYFHIVAEKRYQLHKDKRYKPFMSYDEVLDNIGKCKAILHLVNGGQIGITMRVMESLVHKVKLITDCKELKNYDFYDPNNIFILGEDNLNDLVEFIESPYQEVSSSLFNQMYFEDMIEYIIKIKQL